MKKLIQFFLFISLNIVSINLYSQCGPLVINSINTTPADCPSSGSATVNASGTGLTYQLISGPTGFATSSNSTGIFNSLTAGNYIVKVTDGCSNTLNSNFSIANTYPNYTVAAAEVVPGTLCGDFVLGGELTGTVNGGKPPYQYDFVKLMDGVPVSSPSYSDPTTSLTYNETVPQFGIYRFYALDACGEVRTRDVSALPDQPLPVTMPVNENFGLRPCGETINGIPTTNLYIRMQDANGTLINWANVAGTTINLYSPVTPLTTTSFNCATDTLAGSPLVTYTITSANSGVDYGLVMPQQDVIAIIRTPCGSVLKFCIDFKGLPAVNSTASLAYGQSCGATWNDQTFSVNYLALNTTTPITVTIMTASGNNNQTVTINVSNGYVFTGFKYEDFPITFNVVDACGRTGTYVVVAPTGGEGDPVTADLGGTWICSAQEGTTQVFLSNIKGDIPGRIEATVTISGGPVWAQPLISVANNVNLIATNLVPGYTYTVTWTNTCGGTSTYQFTVPIGGYPNFPPISNNITVTQDALCGQNASNILVLPNSNINFGTKTICLVNTATNTQYACNTSGLFNNVPPGDYMARWVTLWNGNTAYCPAEYVGDSTYITILGDNVGQEIVRKTILICEDANGQQLQTGKAIIEVNGAPPFTYEIIKKSVLDADPATTAWITSISGTNNNTYTWDLPLTGDPFTTEYVLRSVDKCDNKITTQASLQPLVPPTIESDALPCIGTMNYTMSIIPYGGSFTYRWVKLPDVATTLSTTPSLTLAGAYQASFDGTYRCYVSLAGCIERTVETTLSSGNIDVLVSSNPVCIGDNLTLSVSGTGTTFNWSGPNNFTSNVASPTISNVSLLASGTYFVTVTDGSCNVTGSTDVVVENCAPCSIVSITATPGLCNSATNQYALTGTVTFSNPPATGTLTVSVSGGGSQTFNAPFTSPQSYSISGLTSDGVSHTVTAVFSADAACTANTTYTAPASCSSMCPEKRCATVSVQKK